jgi:thymidylate synthase (FAD)
MQLIEQSWCWEQKPPIDTDQILERAGRTCYKSDPKGDPKEFIKRIIKRGHMSVIEHVSASVRLITSRSVSHELVRHRISSISQQSQRYVKYNDIAFIIPEWYDRIMSSERELFLEYLSMVETAYSSMINNWNLKPEDARDILPNCTATELVMTANLREWLHIFKLRCSDKALPATRNLMRLVREGFAQELPYIFGV